MTVYADTSFLVSLYVLDRHTHQAQQRMLERPRIWLTPLHRAEFAHAVAQHVFRRVATVRQARDVHRNFERDRRNGVWAETGMPDAAYELCIRLARKRTARLGSRTLDTLHVASALALGAGRFWTFDGRQAKIATAEKLKIT